MMPTQDRADIDDADAAVVEWLLQGDPSIRWQVMRDLLGASDDAIAAERARIPFEGWGRTAPCGAGDGRVLREVVDQAFSRFPFPPQWHFDIVRALEHLRAVGADRDERLDDAVDLIRRAQQTDARGRCTGPYRVDTCSLSRAVERAGGRPFVR